MVRSGPFDERKKPYGYSDDDYTLWRLKQKVIYVQYDFEFLRVNKS